MFSEIKTKFLSQVAEEVQRRYCKVFELQNRTIHNIDGKNVIGKKKGGNRGGRQTYLPEP